MGNNTNKDEELSLYDKNLNHYQMIIIALI